jgi:catechol 2,3-dioxygenase
MGVKPLGLDHVNIFVRNVERSHRWYTDVLGLHTQDTFTHKGTGRLRAVFLAADVDHAHDIALFDVGDEAPLQQKGQVGLNHFAWRMASVDDLKEMHQRLSDQGVPFSVSDHTISIGIYFADPDGNGLEVYYELPRSEWHRDRPFSGEGAKGRFPGPWDEALRQAAPASELARA